MKLNDLKASHFKEYPAQGRELATRHLMLLRQLPPVFLPILLSEIVNYDWKFPTERNDLEKQLAYLGSLTPEDLAGVMASFGSFNPPAELDRSDLVDQPSEYEQRLTAWLWSTRQMDAFQAAARAYSDRLLAANPQQPPALPRLGIVLIGQGVGQSDYLLFRKLRPHGVHFTNVNSGNGPALLQQALATRALRHPLPYGHWYIDGGSPLDGTWAGVTCMSYAALEPMRHALLRKMTTAIQSGEMGPEALRAMLLRMQPEELGATEADPILSRFEVRVLTEGSGTQIFSTSFAQWTAREVLRRAQPVTLLVRFAPRQRQRPMDELLSEAAFKAGEETDAAGSLVDADMGANYTWIDQQRLSGANEASFLVWFEGHREAVAIGPSMAQGTRSSSAVSLDQILGLVG